MNERIFEYLKERFGIPSSALETTELVKSSDLWVSSRAAARFPVRNPVRRGIRFARILTRGFKLTTAAIQVFGRYATRNVVNLGPLEAARYVRGQDVEVDPCETVENGQVIVTSGEDVLGSGLYKDGRVKNQIPKARRIVN
jgi:NOL1/NOP2/fmu family ribosome biogenesis protein